MKQPPSGYQPTGYLCGSTTSDSPPRRSTYSPGFSFPESSPSSTSSTGPTFSLSNRTKDKDAFVKVFLLLLRRPSHIQSKPFKCIQSCNDISTVSHTAVTEVNSQARRSRHQLDWVWSGPWSLCGAWLPAVAIDQFCDP